MGNFVQSKWYGSSWTTTDLTAKDPGGNGGIPAGAVGVAVRQPSSIDIFTLGFSPFAPSEEWISTGYWNDTQTSWGMYRTNFY
jgi:hypothetical protein